eukprot:1158748-Pelagomonas_calceolata.AAC.10
MHVPATYTSCSCLRLKRLRPCSWVVASTPSCSSWMKHSRSCPMTSQVGDAGACTPSRHRVGGLSCSLSKDVPGGVGTCNLSEQVYMGAEGALL